MSKKAKTRSAHNRAPVAGFSVGPAVDQIASFTLKRNGLTVLYVPRPTTGVVTTNLTYRVGSRDEVAGETGVAHMLEHMLFKPTTQDRARGWRVGSAMRFEQQTGCILNANTWRDRTTYYFSYPRAHLDEALRIEAERMTGVILTDQVLAPERSNVLSEFDMYNGDPYFALDAAMHGVAFLSHPYRHETIGFREDIAGYTAATLERFYRRYYRPDNAVLQVIGDVQLNAALKAVHEHFAAIDRPPEPVTRPQVTEPAQEGIRRVTIERPTNLNILSIGFKHAGFPDPDWWTSTLLVDVLVDGPQSVLQQALVDTGLASAVTGGVEESAEPNLATITITLAPGVRHEKVEQQVLELIATLDRRTITPLLKSVQAAAETDLRFAREHSLRIAHDLTECIAAGDWQVYPQLPEMVRQVSVADVLARAKTVSDASNLTIGYCVSTR